MIWPGVKHDMGQRPIVPHSPPLPPPPNQTPPLPPPPPVVALHPLTDSPVTLISIPLGPSLPACLPDNLSEPFTSASYRPGRPPAAVCPVYGAYKGPAVFYAEVMPVDRSLVYCYTQGDMRSVCNIYCYTQGDMRSLCVTYTGIHRVIWGLYVTYTAIHRVIWGLCVCNIYCYTQGDMRSLCNIYCYTQGDMRSLCV